MLSAIVALAGAYLIGSIPTAYLMVKALKQTDVRTVGSGNVGASNVTRVAGKGAGAVVFALDLSKGLMAVLVLAPWLTPDVSPAVRLGCGCLAVLGHVFPLFLRFRGGKGVATTIGVLLGTMPAVAGVFLLVWTVCALIWRYVSVASLAASATLPIAQILTQRALPEVLMGAGLAMLIIVKHRQNVERLVHGKESRIGSG